MQNFSDDLPDHDPDAWREDLSRWLGENCIHREGREDSGGIGTLLLDFAEWCIKHDAVPCTRGTFERLLWDAGFPLKDGMAAGLLLRVDWESHCAFQNAPQASETPERATAAKQRNTGRRRP